MKFFKRRKKLNPVMADLKHFIEMADFSEDDNWGIKEFWEYVSAYSENELDNVAKKIFLETKTEHDLCPKTCRNQRVVERGRFCNYFKEEIFKMGSQIVSCNPCAKLRKQLSGEKNNEQKSIKSTTTF